MVKTAIEAIRTAPGALSGKRAVLGFDGFIDTLVRVVRDKKGERINTFPRIAEFADYLLRKVGSSCSLELNEITTKFGGNMPNLAAALAGFGLQVDGIGMLGFPAINPEFSGFPSACTLHSFANPGMTLGLEFEDGKVMLYTLPSEKPTWPLILSRIGGKRLNELVKNADLICALNWAEMDESTQIWSGFFDLAVRQTTEKRRTVLFDFSDCTRRDVSEVRSALELLQIYALQFTVILSMNENEARFIHHSLLSKKNGSSLESVGADIHERLKSLTIVIHPHDAAMAWEGNHVWRVPTRFIEKPVISTGGGDTFNAGMCAGLLLELPLAACLVCANASASYYIAFGKYPSPDALLSYLTRHRESFTNSFLDRARDKSQAAME
jgi:hypothetical protein